MEMWGGRRSWSGRLRLRWVCLSALGLLGGRGRLGTGDRYGSKRINFLFMITSVRCGDTCVFPKKTFFINATPSFFGIFSC